MPPSGTQTIVAVTARVRSRAGVNSAVTVVELGSAPPMPRPATKRSMAIPATSCARPMQLVATPNTKRLTMTAQRRPKRSANRPALALPKPIPIRPAATTGTNAALVIPQSLRIEGIA